VACVFIFQLSHTQWACSGKNDANQYSYDWTLEPEEDGSVHVKVEITLGKAGSSYTFVFTEDYRIENIKAWEVETGKGIRCTEVEEEDRIRYDLEFEDEKEKGFKFLVEFDWKDKVEEIEDEVYDLSWGWTTHHKASHTATVILPVKHEVLSAEPLDFEEIVLPQDQVSVRFEKDVSELEPFEFGVIFSKKGKEFRKEGETYFNQGEYREAKEAYLKAMLFYFRIPIMDDRKKYETLNELQELVSEINNILGEPDDPFIYDWALEPKIDGSVHVIVAVTVGRPLFLYQFPFSKNYPVEKIQAWDTETLEPIEFIEIEEKGVVKYMFGFGEEKEKGFKFTVEFDRKDKVEEIEDGVYDLSWGWTTGHKASHTATVILPVKHEVLSAESLELEIIPLDQDQILLKFEKDVSESDPFEFGVTFSKKGKELIENAQEYYNRGKYYEARLAYLEAVEFYSNSEFSMVNNRNTDELLADLEERVENMKRTEYVQGKFTYDWTFEPEEDGNVHVRVEITLGGPCSSYQFNFPKDCSVKSIRAMDEDWNLIEYTYTEEEDLTYIFEFDTEKEKGFKFIVEFDLENEVEKTEKETYYFYWKWIKNHRTSHTATVILPQEHNLSFTSLLTPKETYSMRDHTYVIFWKDVSELEPFAFELTFSKKDPILYILIAIILLFPASSAILLRKHIKYLIFPPIFERIYPNPYIAGNPIRSEEMFFGREDVFQFIKDKFNVKEKNITIVLHGERRTGKTSVLYQIENGRLGKEFVPVYIDIQAMANVNEKEFFAKITDKIIESLVKFPVINHKSNEYIEIKKITKGFDTEPNPYSVFSNFLDKVAHVLKEKYLLVMFDEYEILEKKIKSSHLSPDIIQYMRNLLQNLERFSFIFTGSKKLEELEDIHWSFLFNVATYWRISYLRQKDASDLMSIPVGDKIRYDKKAVNKLLRLTACHPYLLQLFLQNLVDHINKVEKYRVKVEEILHILHYVVDNPPPHMFYVWKDSKPEEKVVLSALAEIIESEDQYISIREIEEKLKENEGILDKKVIKNACSELKKKDILGSKEREAVYNFRVDLLRYWIKNEHPLFEAVEEIE